MLLALVLTACLPDPSVPEVTPAQAPADAAPTDMVSVVAPLPSPSPLIADKQPVPWWFVFKFNANDSFQDCSAGVDRTCTFGGTPQAYLDKTGAEMGWGQQFAFASAATPTLQAGTGCAGDTTADPIGATFGQVYNSDATHFVVWNDQFYYDPKIVTTGCDGKYCEGPWGHSKGMVAWNDDGQGFVLQVTTPSWPAAGSAKNPRATDGNTLGCVKDDNVLVSQHFFALALTKDDLAVVLKALANASVSTDVSNPQVVQNGGPADIQALVTQLGQLSPSTSITNDTLSTGVRLISKPSNLNVPPWQLISATLGGVPLRTATWWESPSIPTTTDNTPPGCWAENLTNPGPVQIATTGTWSGKTIGLTGGYGRDYNHAKIGVTTDEGSTLSIFGDMNQQGALNPTDSKGCASSQNGRGGLFFVVDNKPLHDSVSALIAGQTG